MTLSFSLLLIGHLFPFSPQWFWSASLTVSLSLHFPDGFNSNISPYFLNQWLNPLVMPEFTIVIKISFLSWLLFCVMKCDFMRVWNVDVTKVKVLELILFSIRPCLEGRRRKRGWDGADCPWCLSHVFRSRELLLLRPGARFCSTLLVTGYFHHDAQTPNTM